jgi:hypothetical protein
MSFILNLMTKQGGLFYNLFINSQISFETLILPILLEVTKLSSISFRYNPYTPQGGSTND